MDTERLFYRTGDLVRMDRSSGLLFYVSRIDFQVKLRGQRIECGEIEHVITSNTFCSINRAIVIKWEQDTMEYLVAYVQLQSTADTTRGEANEQIDLQGTLRAYCESRLPQYMVPSMFIVVSEFPLNRNSKIDRKMLPRPNFTEIMSHINNKDAFEAPKSDTERTICALWARLMGVDPDKLSIEANFFSVGGNSLVLMHLARLYETQFSLRHNTLCVNDFFQKPTIHEHAIILDKHVAIDSHQYVE